MVLSVHCWQDGQQEDGEGSDVGTPVLQGRVLEFGARVAPGHGRRLSQGTSAASEQQPERRGLSDDQQRRIAEIEAQIHRLTAVRSLTLLSPFSAQLL